MSRITFRAIVSMSTYAVVVISPKTSTRPVLTAVSHATRPRGSSVSTASSTASEIWSQILSGCPSVTDSEVKRSFGDESKVVVIDVILLALNDCIGQARRRLDGQDVRRRSRGVATLLLPG